MSLSKINDVKILINKLEGDLQALIQAETFLRHFRNYQDQKMKREVSMTIAATSSSGQVDVDRQFEIVRKISNRCSYINYNITNDLELIKDIDLSVFVLQYQDEIKKANTTLNQLEHDYIMEIRELIPQSHQHLNKIADSRKLIETLKSNLTAEELLPIKQLRRTYLAMREQLMNDEFLNNEEYHRAVSTSVCQLSRIQKRINQNLGSEIIRIIEDKNWNNDLKKNLLKFVNQCIGFNDSYSFRKLVALKQLLPWVESNNFLLNYQKSKPIISGLSQNAKARWDGAVQRFITEPHGNASNFRIMQRLVYSAFVMACLAVVITAGLLFPPFAASLVGVACLALLASATFTFIYLESKLSRAHSALLENKAILEQAASADNDETQQIDSKLLPENNWQNSRMFSETKLNFFSNTVDMVAEQQLFGETICEQLKEEHQQWVGNSFSASGTVLSK